MSDLLKIVNEYGNVDVCSSLPKEFEHVPGKRLQPLCRKLGIRYAPALVGWGGSKKYPKPQFDGVVVCHQSADRLRAEIEERERRNPPERREQAALRREKLKEQKNEHLVEMGVNPDGRTARWLQRGEIDEYEARLIAFKVNYRHDYTDYNDLLPTYGREARELITEDSLPSSWAEYLNAYPFPFEDVAKALSQLLRSPQQAHPVWFCEAILAVKQSGMSLDGLTYQSICDAINEWRDVRGAD